MFVEGLQDERALTTRTAGGGDNRGVVVWPRVEGWFSSDFTRSFGLGHRHAMPVKQTNTAPRPDWLGLASQDVRISVVAELHVPSERANPFP